MSICGQTIRASLNDVNWSKEHYRNKLVTSSIHVITDYTVKPCVHVS